MQESLYDDGMIRLDAEGMTIRKYYFPTLTSKRIPYTRIRAVREVPLHNSYRIWGSGDNVHWWHLDRKRPQKTKVLVLDVGSAAIPCITPDDPERVLAILKERLTPDQ
ncbi:MAG TPA: hypothetical protein VFB60_14570 [Ktedonobacteraceae bacterium]|nr:hypothetical protein [Ktedonobacteraceae bacterium]